MAVREGLLALLSTGGRHGYQLKTGFEAATGGLWPLNVGQVYTTLERLERDGLVASTESDGQRRFELTDAGHGELGAWWDAVAFDEPPPRDELVLKVLLAIDHGPAHALGVITAQRTALTVLLQRRRRAASATDDLVTTLAHDALVVRAEADLRWLDLCEARVRAAEPKETPR
jgi:DNA-binding PadR family transcriptional regulator